MPEKTAETPAKKTRSRSVKPRGSGGRLNLHQKLVEVRKTVTEIVKNINGEEFDYCSHAAVLAAVRGKMDALGIILSPEIKETATQLNGEHQVKGNIVFTWINAEKPDDTLTVEWRSYGSNSDISRAVGVMTTYAVKDYLLKFFQIPQNKQDPDAKGNCVRKEVAKPKKEKTKPVEKAAPAKTPPNEKTAADQQTPQHQPMSTYQTHAELRAQMGVSPDPVSTADTRWIDDLCGSLSTPQEWDSAFMLVKTYPGYVDAQESDQRALEDYYIGKYNEFAREFNNAIGGQV